MTETKFTAGPWCIKNTTDIFGPLGGDSGDGVNCDKNDRWQIADLGWCASFVNDELVELGDDVRRANAHLIAAAPELYEALEDLEAFHSGFQVEGIDDPEEALVIALEKARSALSKARGETQ